MKGAKDCAIYVFSKHNKGRERKGSWGDLSARSGSGERKKLRAGEARTRVLGT